MIVLTVPSGKARNIRSFPYGPSSIFITWGGLSKDELKGDVNNQLFFVSLGPVMSGKTNKSWVDIPQSLEPSTNYTFNVSLGTDLILSCTLVASAGCNPFSFLLIEMQGHCQQRCVQLKCFQHPDWFNLASPTYPAAPIVDQWVSYFSGHRNSDGCHRPVTNSQRNSSAAPWGRLINTRRLLFRRSGYLFHDHF